MKKLLLALLILTVQISAMAQAAPGKSTSTEFCSAFKKILAASENNFTPLVSNYKTTEYFYKESLVKLPGFTTYYSISIFHAANMFSFDTMRDFANESDCLAEYDKTVQKINDCIGSKGTDKSGTQQLRQHEWVQGKVNITVAVFKNTNTNKYMLEIFVKKLK